MRFLFRAQGGARIKTQQKMLNIDPTPPIKNPSKVYKPTKKGGEKGLKTLGLYKPKGL